MRQSTKTTFTGASVLFYRAALSLSRQTLTFVSGIIRRHRKSIRPRWRKLSPDSRHFSSWLTCGRRDVRRAGGGCLSRSKWDSAVDLIAICERLIGTLRREILDRTALIMNRAHLGTVLGGYQEHYNTARPHQCHGQSIPGTDPAPRVTAAGPSTWQIRRKPVLSGLFNEYERAA